MINGPYGAGNDTVIKYTSVDATHFHGCTLGVGTLHTGQVVHDANETATYGTGGFGNIGACVTFPAVVAGGESAACRVTVAQGIPFNVGAQSQPTAVNAICTISVTPPIGGGSQRGLLRGEMFQSTGGTITIPIDRIQAPSVGGGIF